MNLLFRIAQFLLPLAAVNLAAQQLRPQWGALLWIAFITFGIVRSRMRGGPWNPLSFAIIAAILGLTVNGYLRLSLWVAHNGTALCYLTLALTALVTVIVGAPFTIGYARRVVPEALWSHPIFLKVNNHVSLAWALTFAVNAGVSARLEVPWASQILSYALMAAAMAFSDIYPKFVRLQHQSQMQA